MQNKWVIIGCGGHARSIADVILDNDQYADIVFLDKNAKSNEKLFGFPIIAHYNIKNEKVIVSVYNNGPCIKEEDLKYIWDRFYKADKSRTNKTSTGLGLPIVRNIILQHNEEIWIDNTDKGVSFSFTLKRIKDD